MPPSLHDASLAAPREPSEQELPYLGGSRGSAVAALSRGLRDHQGPLLLNGPAGVGKSVVLKAVLATLADEPIRVINLSNGNKADWNHRELAGQILGRPIETSTDIAVAAAIAELTAATADERQVIIAVDDAHTLTDKALELLLLIASPVRGGRVPPQLFLAGRDMFFDRDWRSELQVIARLAEGMTIEPLAGADARDYITFRLRRRDASTDLILKADAVSRILHYSGGLPGEIDRILAALEATGSWDDSPVLTGGMVEIAITSLTSRPPSPAPTVPAPVMTNTALASTTDRQASPLRDPVAPISPLLAAVAATTPAPDPEVTIRSNLRVASPSPRPGEDASAWREAAVSAPKATAPASAPAADGSSATRVALPLVRPSAKQAEDPPVATPDAAKSVAESSGITRGQMRAAGAAVAAVVIAAAVGGFVLWHGGQSGQVTSEHRTESEPNRLLTQAAGPEEAGRQLAGPQAASSAAEPNRTAERQLNPADHERSTEPSPARSVAIETAPPSAVATTGQPLTEAKNQAVNVDRAPMPASPPSTPVAVANDLVAVEADKNAMPPVSAPIETQADASSGAGAIALTPILPVASQPAGPQPVPSQAVASQPAASQPVAPQPAASQPVAPQPVAPQPVAPQPVAPQTVASPPGADSPNSRKPRTSRAEEAPPAGPVSMASPVAGLSTIPTTIPNTGPTTGAVSRARTPREAVEDEARPANGTPNLAANGAATPTVAPDPKPTPQFIAALLRRGDTMLQQGDVVAARLFYERAAAAGSGEGATSAGKTYDPNFLATIRAQGLKGDVARAIEWYRMASTVLGDKEAGARLKVLTAQTDR